MRLDIRSFALAAGTTAALLFVICSLAVWLDPIATTAFAGAIIHADLSGLARPLTLGTFCLGLVVWTIGTGAAFGFAGWVYNRLAIRSGTLRG